MPEKKQFGRPMGMSKKKYEAQREEALQEEIRRVKLPRGRQTFGIVEQRVGGTRMRVRCLDGKTRMCRIPGRLKRSLWVREGDTVLVEPWELGGDEKGDILYKYRQSQIQWLKKSGRLDQLKELEEF